MRIGTNYKDFKMEGFHTFEILIDKIIDPKLNLKYKTKSRPFM